MSAHTPGTWVVDLTGPMTLGGDYLTIEAVSNETGLVQREICTVPIDTDEYPNGKEFLEDCANARLIVVAPELLEACKRVIATGLNVSIPTLVWKQLQDVIAKAEGREVAK